MKKIMCNKIKYLIIILLIVFFMVSFVPKEMQNDTFFTIAIGNNILENGIQKEEQMVWHENLEFTNPRWLFDVIVASIYNKCGFLGIYIMVIAIASIQALLYLYILNKITRKTLFSFICTLIIMYFSMIEFTARAQIFSFTIFLIEFYCIEQLLETNKNKYFVLLAIMPIILVNVHSSVYPMYFVMYLPYIAEFILNKLKLKSDQNSKIIIKNRDIKKIIILIIIAFIEGFLVPNSLEPYSYMFKNMNGYSKTFIAELQTINVLEWLSFLIMILTPLVIIAFTKTKIRVTDGFFIIGFALMALNTIRCICFFYLISSICIIRLINDCLNDYNIKLKFTNLKMICGIEIIFCLIFVSCCCCNFSLRMIDNYVKTVDYPVDATKYILSNIDIENMKIFNSFDFGSYLELNGIKAFIDSRSEVYTEEFNPGCTILQDWYQTYSGDIDYTETFEKYGITHALLSNDEIINEKIWDDPNWKLLYQDDNFSFYEKVQ